MAEQIARDVVKEAQSMGSLPVDDTAKPTNTSPAADGNPTTKTTTSDTQAPEIDGIAGPDAVPNETITDPLQPNEPSPTLSPEHSADVPASEQSTASMINGTTLDSSAVEDGAVNNSVAEGSGGSDTDTSRDIGKDASRGHTRTGSIKKPTFFKSSSVTKTFMAKAASSTPTTPGTKAAVPAQGATPALQTTKPRLVAKSGSGLGNLPRLGLKSNGANAGPDASKVWNKNRPVPPPPPKQFTDEELKQQYGIHMATRLQADDSKNDQSKWADIDDDEDDWAPETVEWMDGTKSTVATAENVPAVEEPKAAPPKQEKPAEPAPTPAPAVQRPSSTSGTKTILKPGAAAQSSQTRQGGLVLKGLPDKPNMAVKSPAPTPAKSPWAPLPPVEKVPPVQINPPAQPPQQTRFAQRDAHGFDALPPLTSPAAKEIAADDFSRTWRDERGNKELFNSQSGRYEPVNETRRGSIRDRDGHRQPAVLQRPTPGQGQGPAEPSPAFQTSRSNQENGSWSRRRASSNVSGSSGRRMSFTRPQDGHMGPTDLQQRRESQVLENSPLNESARSSFAPHRGQQQEAPSNTQNAWVQRSPATSHTQPVSPYGSVDSSNAPEVAAPAAAPAPDPVELQQQMMRDRIERARQAKQKAMEEEAQAEAAKKERLQKLMAKLEPATPVSAAPAASPVKEKATTTVTSPPKPPAPATDGEPTQYGMMKVHPSHTVKKASPPASSAQPAVKEVSRSRGVEMPARNGATAVTSASQDPSPSKSDGPSVRTIPEAGLAQAQAKSEVPLPGAQNLAGAPPTVPSDSQQTWKQQPDTTFPSAPTPWGSSFSKPPSVLPPSTNVWGPIASRDKALGNGTFDNSYNRAPARHSLQGSQAGPGPIAPPSKVSPSPVSSQAIPSHSQIHDQQHLFQSHPDVRLPVAPIGAPSPNHNIPQPPPGPIAPPSKAMPGAQEPLFGVGAWKSLANNAGQHDAALRAQRLEKRQGQVIGAPKFDETYKKTEAGSRVGERRVVKTEQVLHQSSVHGATPAIENVNLGQERAPVQQLAAASQHTTNLPAHGHGKSSRFFPSATSRQVLPAPAVNGTPADVDADAPPPPDTFTFDHPAFDGDLNRPKVNLPIPKAVVKLPPAPAPAPHNYASAVIMPSRPTQYLQRPGSQPLVAQPTWQDRFNGLLGRSGGGPTKTSPNPPAAVISSSSKASFDVTPRLNSATVSLPSSRESNKSLRKVVFVVDDSHEIVSKVSAEEVLLEDREFGSLPAVRISRPSYFNVDQEDFPMMRSYPGHTKDINLTTANELPLHYFEEVNAQGIVVRIALPNSKRAASTVILPRAKYRRTSGYQGYKKKNFPPRGDNHNTNNTFSRRKSSNHHHSQSSVPPGSSRTSTHRNSWKPEGNHRNHSSSNTSWHKQPSPAVVH